MNSVFVQTKPLQQITMNKRRIRINKIHGRGNQIRNTVNL